MNDVESFANSALADADAQGSIHLTVGPVLTTFAAFLGGVAVSSATVAAYEAGADG